MKRESYFTPDLIDAKSQSMLDDLVAVRRAAGRAVPGKSEGWAETTALLVLDMQNYFLREDSHAFIPSAPAILPRIQQLIDSFAARRQSVIFTRHVNDDSSAGVMGTWWRDLIYDGDERSLLVPSLNVIAEKYMFPTIVKTQYDGFYKTNLDDMLKRDGITHVVITGVMTHLCCETTARSAFVHGYEVLFVVDGTATYAESFHRASLLNLSHGFASLVLSKDLI